MNVERMTQRVQEALGRKIAGELHDGDFVTVDDSDASGELTFTPVHEAEVVGRR